VPSAGAGWGCDQTQAHIRVGAQAASPPEPHRGGLEPSQGSRHNVIERATTWIAHKRDGGALDEATIGRFMRALVEDRLPDYQVAALLMAILLRGMQPAELRAWTRAMIESGDRMSLADVPGPKVDKHSTGGVGDKISICLAPLVAACGVGAPMLVGRALGHSGGTLDKLEAIPGFRHQLTPAQFRRVLRATGFVIAGQTRRLVPADRKLYALRDATATVESIPLIASSILSKKVAGGADALLLDVKLGRAAFFPSARTTRQLARTLVDLGRHLRLPTVALLTAMDQPLGRQVGNASEVAEALEVLRGGGPDDTRALTVRLGAEMLRLGGVARSPAAGARLIESAISSGAGMERLVRGGGPAGRRHGGAGTSRALAARAPATGAAGRRFGLGAAPGRPGHRPGRDAAGGGAVAQGRPGRSLGWHKPSRKAG
jgi:pyrimidine-nucleoside phosphorylase